MRYYTKKEHNVNLSNKNVPHLGIIRVLFNSIFAISLFF